MSHATRTDDNAYHSDKAVHFHISFHHYGPGTKKSIPQRPPTAAAVPLAVDVRAIPVGVVIVIAHPNVILEDNVEPSGKIVGVIVGGGYAFYGFDLPAELVAFGIDAIGGGIACDK
ncbi:MAG TPA: hypothetical protein VF275_12640 [Gammaproteobacteria bacterium]